MKASCQSQKYLGCKEYPRLASILRGPHYKAIVVANDSHFECTHVLVCKKAVAMTLLASIMIRRVMSLLICTTSVGNGLAQGWNFTKVMLQEDLISFASLLTSP